MFTAALFTKAEIGKQPECTSMDKWIKKLWYTYTMEYCSAIKRIKSYICDGMEGPRGYYGRGKGMKIYKPVVTKQSTGM